MREGPAAGPRHPDEDALVELCLGHADPRTHEEVSAHLDGCTTCRAAYDELADAVEAVLPASPRVAPPAGFESRVLTALDGQPRDASRAVGDSQAARSVTGGSQNRDVAGGRRSDPRTGGSMPSGPAVPRRTVLLTAAAGLLGVATGVGVTAYRGRTPEVPPTEDPWAVPLLTSSGAEVGIVTEGYDDRGPVLVVTVPGGRPGLTVTCLLELTDGRIEDRGRWTLSAERANSWVVPLGDDEAARVDLIDDAGSVWASATL